MKGIVFTEFLEMVEASFGPNVADQMIVDSAVPSGGVYTSVRTYDHKELVAMVVQLSALTKTPPPVLVSAFGRYLFGRFATLYTTFFTGVTSSFAFLHNIESYIHPEVRKLYPDAELPHFDVRDLEPGGLEMIYRSSRHFADLAEGLILGCVAHFKEAIALTREPVTCDDGSQAIRFVLRQQPQS